MSLNNIHQWLTATQRNRFFFSEKASPDRSPIDAEISELLWVVGELERMVSTLKSKEDYLSWRSVWREAYAKISDESRWAKSYRKASIHGHPVSERSVHFVRAARILSNKMLETRKASKVHTEQRYQIERAKEAKVLQPA